MKKKHYLLASGVSALALLVGAPVFADSDRGDRSLNANGHFGIGSIVRLLANDNERHDRTDRPDRNSKDRDGKDKDDNDAATTVNNTVTIVGTITAINGSQITLSGNNGTTYSVDAAGARLSGSGHVVVLGDFRVGDRIVARGTLNGTALLATQLRDTSLVQRFFLSAIGAAGAGVVTSLSGSTFTIDPIGLQSTTSVSTDASTTFKVNGQATTSSALDVGSRVIVFGTSTSDTSITASLVSILNLGFGFLKHIFLFR